MDGVTVSQCQAAIQRFGPELMQRPGVQGLGVSQPPTGTAEGPATCAVIIYVDSEQHVGGLPQELTFVNGGQTIRIPTTIAVIGTVTPE